MSECVTHYACDCIAAKLERLTKLDDAQQRVIDKASAYITSWDYDDWPDAELRNELRQAVRNLDRRKQEKWTEPQT